MTTTSWFHTALRYLGFAETGPHRLSALSHHDHHHVAVAVREGRAIDDRRLVAVTIQTAARLCRVYRWGRLVFWALGAVGVGELVVNVTGGFDPVQLAVGSFWTVLGPVLGISYGRLWQRGKKTKRINSPPKAG